MSLRLPSFLLRIGLAVVFAYAATASFLDPITWVGYFPRFLREIVPGETLLPIFSVYEIGLALWLLSGVRVFPAALLSAATMAAIVIPNMAVLDVVFRDVAILFMALALAALHRSDQRPTTHDQRQ